MSKNKKKKDEDRRIKEKTENQNQKEEPGEKAEKETKVEKVEHVEEGVFKIESKSKPGTFHTVRKEYDQYSCDCEGFRYRKACRHVELVYIKNEKEAKG